MIDRDEITRKVEETVKRAGTSAVDGVLSAYDVKVETVNDYSPLLHDSFATYYKCGTTQKIYIAEHCPDSKYLFILAHEIGHMVLHAELGLGFWGFNDRRTRVEEEANAFAAKLLCYGVDLRRVDKYDLIEDYGIPEEMIEYLFN